MQIKIKQKAHYDVGHIRPMTVDLLSDELGSGDADMAKAVLNEIDDDTVAENIRIGGFGGCVWIMIFNGNFAVRSAVSDIIRCLRGQEAQRKGACNGINQRLENTFRQISESDEGIKFEDENEEE